MHSPIAVTMFNEALDYEMVEDEKVVAINTEWLHKRLLTPKSTDQMDERIVDWLLGHPRTEVVMNIFTALTRGMASLGPRQDEIIKYLGFAHYYRNFHTDAWNCDAWNWTPQQQMDFVDLMRYNTEYPPAVCELKVTWEQIAALYPHPAFANGVVFSIQAVRGVRLDKPMQLRGGLQYGGEIRNARYAIEDFVKAACVESGFMFCELSVYWGMTAIVLDLKGQMHTLQYDPVNYTQDEKYMQNSYKTLRLSKNERFINLGGALAVFET